MASHAASGRAQAPSSCAAGILPDSSPWCSVTRKPSTVCPRPLSEAWEQCCHGAQLFPPCTETNGAIWCQRGSSISCFCVTAPQTARHGQSLVCSGVSLLRKGWWVWEGRSRHLWKQRGYTEPAAPASTYFSALSLARPTVPARLLGRYPH